MDYARFSVSGTEFEHRHQAERSFLLVDTVVIDRSFTHGAPVVYALKEEAVSLDRDSLMTLGTLSSLSRDRRQLQLTDRTVVSYVRLVTVSCPAPNSSRPPHQLENGAFRTIHHAIRCSDIRSEIPEMAHAGKRDYSAKLPDLSTTLLRGAATLFVEHLHQEMRRAFPNRSPALGLHCGNNWFCQVHT